MGKLLQIRVSAWTYNEDDVKETWEGLSALAWRQPARPGEKRGVLELATALENGLAFAEWPKDVADRLRPGIARIGEIRIRLEQALADWNPREANRLSDVLEDELSLLEEQAPPA